MSVKSAVRKFVPKFAINLYHGLFSWLAALSLGFPAKKLIIIGVTGTNGKTTTANLIYQELFGLGHNAALSSSVSFIINGREWFNTYKMTMPGHGVLQKFLHQAVKEGCRYAVIETSSEGLAQNRHWGIYYDVAVFTNLTPEHIDSHGSFYNYKKAKKILFNSLRRRWRKNIDGRTVATAIVANADDPHAPYFLHAQADLKITFGLKPSPLIYTHLQASEARVSLAGLSYKLGNDNINLKLKGTFDLHNSLAALAAAQVLDLPLSQAQGVLAQVEGVPGRLEVIQAKPFLVLVDYAVEPEGMKQLYQTLDAWGESKNNLIQVLGSAGGGRDVSRRPVLGELAGLRARTVIITNEDPYDDDPEQIISQISRGAESAGKVLNRDLFTITDRRQAIAKALSLAQSGDVVLVTGKGAEQKMAIAGGKYIDWDDRKVIREELAKLAG